MIVREDTAAALAAVSSISLGKRSSGLVPRALHLREHAMLSIAKNT
jgi:hypothetical protein